MHHPDNQKKMNGHDQNALIKERIEAVETHLPEDSPHLTEKRILPFCQLGKDCPLRTIWLKPINTIRRVASHSAIDQKADRDSLLVFLMAAILLRMLMSIPSVIGMVLSAQQGYVTYANLTITLLLHVLFIPFLLFWAFYRLYPILLHRFQLIFGGHATEAEMRIGFGWAFLWLFFSQFMVWLILGVGELFAINTYSTGWSIFSGVVTFFFTLLGLLVFICLMGAIARLAFWRSFSFMVLGTIFPVFLLYYAFSWIGGLTSLFGYGHFLLGNSGIIG